MRHIGATQIRKLLGIREVVLGECHDRHAGRRCRRWSVVRTRLENLSCLGTCRCSRGRIFTEENLNTRSESGGVGTCSDRSSPDARND